MIVRRLLTALACVSFCLAGAVAHGQGAPPPSDPNAGKRPVKVVIFPLLVQTPLFGASIRLPRIPSAPGGGGDGESGEISGSTGTSINSAYLLGIVVETNRLFVEASGTWADVSADRERPRVSVKTDTVLFAARGGVRVFKGLSATAGVHHVGMDLDATLELPALDRTIQGKGTAGYWDPMVGVDWRGSRGRWSFQTSFEGGGFGVGTDVDLAGEVRADLRLWHFDLRFGYSVSHLEATIADVNIGSFRRTLDFNQTLHGPNVGLGIVF
jgi:hypothetical protein